MPERCRGVKWGVRAVVAMVCALCACEARPAARSVEARDAGASARDEGVTTTTPQTDALRATPSSPRIVASSDEIPVRPRRIVSLAPNVTELLFALGVEPERVVGVTRFCDRPAGEVEKIAKVGGFIDPDMEKILSLEPDLILGMKVGDVKLVDKLDGANLRHVFFEMDTLAQTLEAMAVMGEVVGAPEQGRALQQKIAARLGDAPGQRRGPATLFLVGREPLVMAGEGTFAAELVARAGGRMAADKQNYVMVDMEYVLKLDPEVILDTSMPADPDEKDTFWSAYEGLRAVKGGAVHGFDASLMRPGPGLIEAQERLEQIYASEHKKHEGASK